MKDVIERMLRVEEEARTILAEAEKRAGAVAEAARREASEKSEALRAEAHVEATKRLEATRAELAHKREERLSTFDRDSEAYAEKVRPQVPEAAGLIVRRVLGG